MIGSLGGSLGGADIQRLLFELQFVTIGQDNLVSAQHGVRGLTENWYHLIDQSRFGHGILSTLGIKTLPGFTTACYAGAAAVGVASGAIIAADVGLVKFTSNIMSATSFYENATMSFVQLLGSMDAAKARMKWLSELAWWSPFPIRELIDASAMLDRMGLKSEQYLKTVGDAAAALHKPIMEGVLALAGASRGQMERLIMFGLTAADIEAELGHKINRKTLEGQREVVEAVTAIWAREHGGMMKMMATSWDSLIAGLRDKWFEFSAKVGEAGTFEVLKADMNAVLATIVDAFESGRVDEWARDVSDNLIRIREDAVKTGAALGRAVDAKNLNVGTLINVAFLPLRGEFKVIHYEAEALAFVIRDLYAGLVKLGDAARMIVGIPELLTRAASMGNVDVITALSAAYYSMYPNIVNATDAAEKFYQVGEHTKQSEYALTDAQIYRMRALGQLDDKMAQLLLDQNKSTEATKKEGKAHQDLTAGLDAEAKKREKILAQLKDTLQILAAKEKWFLPQGPEIPIGLMREQPLIGLVPQFDPEKAKKFGQDTAQAAVDGWNALMETAARVPIEGEEETEVERNKRLGAGLLENFELEQEIIDSRLLLYAGLWETMFVGGRECYMGLLGLARGYYAGVSKYSEAFFLKEMKTRDALKFVEKMALREGLALFLETLAKRAEMQAKAWGAEALGLAALGFWGAAAQAAAAAAGYAALAGVAVGAAAASRAGLAKEQARYEREAGATYAGEEGLPAGSRVGGGGTTATTVAARPMNLTIVANTYFVGGPHFWGAEGDRALFDHMAPLIQEALDNGILTLSKAA
jgi:hypothetical protein